MPSPRSTMLFISHSSSDRALVKSLVGLIEKCFVGLNRPQIRCTSVEGYKLDIGDTPKTKLPPEIRTSLVLCLITPHSLASPWVLFELGAAWGLSKKVMPLLHKVKHTELPAALSGSIAANIESQTDVLAIIDQIRRTLGWEPSDSARQHDALADFMNAVKLSDITSPERLIFRKQIKEELPWSEVARRTNRELYIWGWSGMNAVNGQTRNTILSILQRGKRVNFLVLNASSAKLASDHLSMAPVCSWTEALVQEDISKGREEVLKLRESITDRSIQKRLTCKETDWFMSWSGIAIDPSEAHGLLQIESYLYNYSEPVKPEDHLNYRPNLLLTPASKFYAPYWYSIEQMWDAANTI